MRRYACPYLKAEVELTDEREAHVLRGHPELVSELELGVAEVLGDPDEVRRDVRYPDTRLFSRFFSDRFGGKHIVVGVITDPVLAPGHPPRRWIVTAYVARELTQGVTEWKRD